MVRPVAVVTLFAGVPENRASSPLVKPVVPPFQFKLAVFQVPLAVPDQVSVAACADRRQPNSKPAKAKTRPWAESFTGRIFVVFFIRRVGSI